MSVKTTARFSVRTATGRGSGSGAVESARELGSTSGRADMVRNEGGPGTSLDPIRTGPARHGGQSCHPDGPRPAWRKSLVALRLEGEEVGVPAAQGHQLLVRALLDDLPLLD